MNLSSRKFELVTACTVIVSSAILLTKVDLELQDKAGQH